MSFCAAIDFSVEHRPTTTVVIDYAPPTSPPKA